MGDNRQVDPEQQRRRAQQRRPNPAEPARSAVHPPAHPLLSLQRTIGNAQVSRLLAQRADDEEEIQAQRAEDDEEIQAQRAEDDEEIQAQRAEDDEIQAQREIGPQGGTLGGDSATSLHTLRGGGAPLEPGLRVSMESALGADLGDVRVHSGGQADALNRVMGARAFTAGSDIVLRNDQSPADAHLMAHELTHVVQQRSMAAPSGDGPQVRPAGDAYEQAADQTAERLERDGLV